MWPVLSIIDRGLRPAGAWDLSAVGDVLTDPVIRRVAWFTLWQAVASTVLTVLVGIPGAALFARYAFAGKRFLWSALLVPFVLPTVVVGVAFLGVIGPNGVSGDRPVRDDLGGAAGARLLQLRGGRAHGRRATGRRSIPGSSEAARTLGASPWRAFREVTWPLLRPAVSAAASIVFLFTFTSFGVVLILGGIRQRTLEVEIYDQTSRFLHLDIAAGLALVQLVVVVVALAWFSRTQQRRAVVLDRRPAVGGRDRAPGLARSRLRRREPRLHGAAAGASSLGPRRQVLLAPPTAGAWPTTRRWTRPDGARQRSSLPWRRWPTRCCSPWPRRSSRSCSGAARRGPSPELAGAVPSGGPDGRTPRSWCRWAPRR